MKVTIRDVAKRAGVSVGTVSRALNGYTDINGDTKKKILEIVAELEYTPNAVAKSLSSRVSRNIGVILTNFLQTSNKDNGTLQILQGIYLYASKHKYEVSIYMSEEDSHTRLSYEKFCEQHNISGAILSGITTKDPYFNELVTDGIPCVLIDVPLQGKGLGCVSIDNREAARQITLELLNHNHKRFMVIAGKKWAAVNAERLESIVQTLKEHEIDLPEEAIAYCDFKEEKAYETVKEYLMNGNCREVTAFICLSDLMAMGCMRAIRECGYQVPEHFSVTGFDDHPFTMYASPKLTTVSQDFKEIGYQSARLLSYLIKNPAENQNVTVDFKLCRRESVRKLK